MTAPLGITSRSWHNLPKGYHYLAEIACTRKVWPKASATRMQWEPTGYFAVEQLLKVKSLWNWQTHRIAEGEKGPLVAAFARLRIYLSPERTPESARWLLLRNDANGQIKYALSDAPPTTPMRELVRVSGARGPLNVVSRKTNPNSDSITMNTAPGRRGIGICGWCF